MPTSQALQDDENTPLLTEVPPQPISSTSTLVLPEGDESTARAEHAHDRKQILVLTLCGLADPIAFFVILPFVPFMVEELGHIDQTKVGFYAGLIESCFSLVQMVTSLGWGKFADKYGRKPTLSISLLGTMIFTCLFGFSQTLWQMFLCRCLAGIFSGNIVALRAMLSESTTPQTQASAFSLYAFFKNFGLFLGTLIGGLAKPASQYKSVFGGVWFFERFPFAFPCLVAGVIMLINLLMSLFLVKETLYLHKDVGYVEEERLTTMQLFKTPGVLNVLAILGLGAVLGFSLPAVAPVFFYTDVEHGGFALQPREISWLFMIGGISQAVYSLLLFPLLHKSIGTGGVLRLTAAIWPIAFALNPLGNVILRKHWYTLFKIFAPISMIFGSSCAMAFVAIQLAVNDIAPSRSSLGTLNGMAISLSSFVRAFTPGLFSSIYAFGVDNMILRGEFVWAIMIGVAITFGLTLYWLPRKVQKLPSQS